MKLPTDLRTNVRFTQDEFHKIIKDHLLTQKSIPWLLKAVYFERANFNPALDTETRKRVSRDLAGIGNNLNQAMRYVHSGILQEYGPMLIEACDNLNVLRSYFGQGYGHRKNSL